MADDRIWDRKAANAVWHLSYDFGPQLKPGDTLLSGTVLATGVEVDEIDNDTTKIYFRVRGGTPKLVATLEFQGTTAGGEVLAEVTKMGIA